MFRRENRKKPENIVVATYATQKYHYALPNFGRRFVASIHYANIERGTFIFIGDESEVIKEASEKYIESQLPIGWSFRLIQLPLDDGNKNYKSDAQLLIAQMQSVAFSEARKLNADLFWSLESDVLVGVNSLQVSLDSLDYDKGYYDVCMCTYPSQGGGSYLGGHGDEYMPIYEDFNENERMLPESLINSLKKHRGVPEEKRKKAWHKKNIKLLDEIKKHPPKNNVFALNGENWRKRGWLEYAYPALGKGTLLPTDWVGLGCTLISKKALSYAHFDGYQGHGTQDLYLGYNFWANNDIKMCVSTHAPCDHITRKINSDGAQDYEKIEHIQAFHENDGECKGHLRRKHIPFYTHIPGEKPHESSDSV